MQVVPAVSFQRGHHWVVVDDAQRVVLRVSGKALADDLCRQLRQWEGATTMHNWAWLASLDDAAMRERQARAAVVGWHMVYQDDALKAARWEREAMAMENVPKLPGVTETTNTHTNNQIISQPHNQPSKPTT